MIDFIGLAIVLLLAVAFGYLVKRAWGSKNKILKWVGVIGAGLLTLVFAAAFIGALVGTMRLNQNFNASNPVSNVTIQATPEQLAFGAKYAKFCAGCHSGNQQLPLSGNNFGAEIPIPFGTLYAPNLTPAGNIKDWTDGEVIRAIREGVHKSGRALIIMPSNEFHALSDEDVQGLVAYLRSQPAVEPNTPPTSMNVIGALLLGATGGLTRQPAITQPAPKPAVAVNAEYGKYVSEILVCRACHGEKLTGGAGFDGSPAPNLTEVIPQWTEEQFLTAFRTGALPGGAMLDNAKMPYKEFSEFATDTDLKALYLYLHGLTPSK
ncbi:MAG: c-type cytochrome [Chloroflexota bacterium]|nr:MAG: c-type cytochrome [Chloroflexota bacterium]